MAFVSNEKLGRIPGDAVVPEEPRNLEEHPNRGVTKQVMCAVIHKNKQNLGRIPGDAVVPEEPRNLVEHPSEGVTK